MNAPRTVDITLGFDEAYAPHAAAVIASVVRHAPGARFRFLLLHTGVQHALREKVEAGAKGAEFFWSEISDDDVPAMESREHFSRAILFRLGLDKHAPPDWRRVIYLDADVIVAQDIRRLWETDLGEAAVGAVIDCFVDAVGFAHRWGLSAGAPAYFNSGVLLIDLERARSERVFANALEFTIANIGALRFVDQDALNYACWGCWAHLDPIWNAQRHMAIPSLRAELPTDRHLQGRAPAIIHFTGPEKPWLSEGYHPWAWSYWENLARTPFADEVSRRQGVTAIQRAKLWLRYMRRQP